MLPLELVIARQLADYICLPVVIVDRTHVVMFYNEAAELLIGRRYEDEGDIPWTAWTEAFSFTDDEGGAIPVSDMPMARALKERRVASATFWMQGLDGVRHHVSEMAIPLLAQEDRFLGVMAIFGYLNA